MSGHAGGAMSESGMIESGDSCWNRITSSFRSRIINSSSFVADIWSSQCRPLSGHFDGALSELSMVENVGVAVGIASPVLSIQ